MTGRIIADTIGDIRFQISETSRVRLSAAQNGALHTELVAIYRKCGYHLIRSTTPEEARRLGESLYNATATSITSYSIVPDDGWDVVFAQIQPTPYLFCLAMSKLAEQRELGDEELAERTPRMTNVSILAPVRYDGGFVLVSQVKGRTIGSGAIYPAIVAGAVDATDLNEHDPLAFALEREAHEEMGQTASAFNPTSPRLLSDEFGGGYFNFTSVARRQTLDMLLDIFVRQADRSEVGGLALLPIDGRQLVKRSGRYELDDVVYFKFDTNGTIQKSVGVGIARPGMVAIMRYFASSANRIRLLGYAEL